ncbi:MAG: hypothetical protein HUJ22_02565 [Gracilimonas sp.]|uniref:hypothetical protein n=1 Tax=Gracilimonas sp. TaxID=1974203 RepID=UPI00198F109B|nr:hypothetical protein [Gracilimonas sp.]MBD3615428.1 hypothetical protein [Gracilimonas sp.]
MEDSIAQITELDFSFLIYIFIKLGILTGVYFWSKRLNQNWRTVINVGIIILVIRMILFQNPLAWYLYTHTLDPEVIGWRQSSVLYDEFTQFKKHENVESLAIGSSQVGFIYGFESDRESNLVVKSLAGIGPVDLYLYRHNIQKYNPKRILLYLSDFDMGRAPTLESIKLSPAQGIHFPDVYFDLRQHFSGERFIDTIKEMLVGEFFPEYKYSFIFKGYIDQFFNKKKVFPTPLAKMSSEEHEQYQFEQLKTVIDEENIGTNLYYLKKFISFFEQKGISVVIFEGQYHPKAYTEYNLIVKNKVQEEFENLEKVHSNLNFVPNSELIWFEASDFRDAYHVTHEAGKRFIEKARSLEVLKN